MTDLVEVDITALAAGGDAVGRDAAGRVTFVAGAAPGERVRARVVERHKSFARAELVEIVAPSPARVAPPCPLAAARTCGGCPWMHVAADAQLAAKQALAAGALRRLIAGGLELRPPLAPVPALGWRRRARFHWDGPVIGLDAPRSRRVTDVAACPQLEPRLDAALAAVRAALVPALEGRGDLHLALGHQGDVHVVVAGPASPRLVAAAGALVGRAGITGVIAGGQVAGAAAIELEPGLVGPADAFAQASAAGNQALVAAVVAAVAPRPGLRLLELHAGSGNFTRPLVAAGARVDAVLLDPPRTGARDAVAALVALAPPRVIYVACDAATLARDLELLAAAGWAPRHAQVLDLMPQTSHSEIVAVAERAALPSPP